MTPVMENDQELSAKTGSKEEDKSKKKFVAPSKAKRIPSTSVCILSKSTELATKHRFSPHSDRNIPSTSREKKEVNLKGKVKESNRPLHCDEYGQGGKYKRAVKLQLLK